MAILKLLQKHCMTLLIFGAVFLSAPGWAASSSLQLQEHKIKAGLLYNFLKYTSWPVSAFVGPQDAFQVCLFGGDAFDEALKPLQGRTAQQRPINIQEIYRLESLPKCHLIFVHNDLENDLSSVMAAVRNQPALTMSDIEGFSEKGGMVEFSRTDGKKIHLYLSRRDIERANLRVGEQLLKLAGSR